MLEQHPVKEEIKEMKTQEQEHDLGHAVQQVCLRLQLESKCRSVLFQNELGFQCYN